MNDLSLDEFCDVVSILDPCPPDVARLDVWGTQYYASQKAHVFDWFAHQDTVGSGAYSRRKPNTSVRLAYNRLLNPGMLVWIAFALGADVKLIEKATEAAVEAEKQDYRRRCTAFREVISFDTIAALFEQPKKWKYDPAMEGIYTIGPDNRPHMMAGQENRFDQLLLVEDLA